MVGRSVCAFLAAIVATASALACPKIEYAEANDWSPDELQRQYCAPIAAMRQSTAAAKAAPTPQAGMMILRSSNGCFEQGTMYERIFKNVHKMDVPTCQ